LRFDEFVRLTSWDWQVRIWQLHIMPIFSAQHLSYFERQKSDFAFNFPREYIFVAANRKILRQFY